MKANGNEQVQVTKLVNKTNKTWKNKRQVTTIMCEIRRHYKGEALM